MGGVDFYSRWSFRGNLKKYEGLEANHGGEPGGLWLYFLDLNSAHNGANHHRSGGEGPIILVQNFNGSLKQESFLTPSKVRTGGPSSPNGLLCRAYDSSRLKPLLNFLMGRQPASRARSTLSCPLIPSLYLRHARLFALTCLMACDLQTATCGDVGKSKNGYPPCSSFSSQAGDGIRRGGGVPLRD